MATDKESILATKDDVLALRKDVLLLKADVINFKAEIIRWIVAAGIAEVAITALLIKIL